MFSLHLSRCTRTILVSRTRRAARDVTNNCPTAVPSACPSTCHVVLCALSECCPLRKRRMTSSRWCLCKTGPIKWSKEFPDIQTLCEAAFLAPIDALQIGPIIVMGGHSIAYYPQTTHKALQTLKAKILPSIIASSDLLLNHHAKLTESTRKYHPIK